MGALFSSQRGRGPDWASDATTGEDVAFYLQLDLEPEPKDVCELGPGPSGKALLAILAAPGPKPKSLHAVELSEKNRKRLEKEFEKEIAAGALTILPSSTALADASIDILYGVHGLHCMNSISDVLAELLRKLRPGGKLVWGCTSEGDTRVADGAMRAAGFVEVKVDVTRLKGYARWTPVVGTKAS